MKEREQGKVIFGVLYGIGVKFRSFMLIYDLRFVHIINYLISLLIFGIVS